MVNDITDISTDLRFQPRAGRVPLTREQRLVRERARQQRKRDSDPVFREKERHKSRIIGPKQTEFYKEAVMNVYTNGEQTCRHCGQGDLDVLCLDHIGNDGASHKRGMGENPINFAGMRMYRWVVKNDYPPIFQVLCASCNLKKEVVRRRNNRKALTEAA